MRKKPWSEIVLTTNIGIAPVTTAAAPVDLRRVDQLDEGVALAGAVAGAAVPDRLGVRLAVAPVVFAAPVAVLLPVAAVILADLLGVLCTPEEPGLTPPLADLRAVSLA